jgi:hypothetical protein
MKSSTRRGVGRSGHPTSKHGVLQRLRRASAENRDAGSGPDLLGRWPVRRKIQGPKGEDYGALEAASGGQVGGQVVGKWWASGGQGISAPLC